MRKLPGKSCKKSGLAVAVMLIVSAGASLSGCRSNAIPDPNDPRNAAPEALAKLLHRTIKATADELNDRVLSGQISDALRRKLLSKKADELLAYGDPSRCQPPDAWIYGDLLLTSGKFAEAIPALKKAVQYATSVNDDDRRVNDSLRLARALALTGQTTASLNLAQAVIDSKPRDPGPVLPSVLLEITPATEGKGHDEQLAHLLEEAIHEHLRVRVNVETMPGRFFLMARSHHIGNAWRKIVTLLKNSGHPDQAIAAEKRGQEMMEELRGQLT